MDSRAGNAAPTRSLRTREVLVDFVPEKVKAPFLLRCGALLIDYIVVIVIPVVGLVLGRLMGNDGAVLLNSNFITVGRIAAILLAVTNLIVLPVFTGQSIGKMVTGLRIVRLDGTTVSAGMMLFRQIGGYLLTAATLGTGFMISTLSSKGRALQDYLAGTVVIYADKRARR
ncbi:MAG TPA: RDD family protein [Pyrinomonadaceae bacterium]|nr:RDD family protein [Pyrinomonadaceae bacterium]